MTCHLVEKVEKLQSYLAGVIVSWCVNPQEVAKFFLQFVWTANELKT